MCLFNFFFFFALGSKQVLLYGCVRLFIQYPVYCFYKLCKAVKVSSIPFPSYFLHNNPVRLGWTGLRERNGSKGSQLGASKQD